MNTEPSACVICGSSAPLARRLVPMPDDSDYTIEDTNCPLCGTYWIDDTRARLVLAEKSKDEKLKVAILLTERLIHGARGPILVWPLDMEPPRATVPAITWEDLLKSYPATMTERLDRTLLNFEKLAPEPGTDIRVDERLMRATFSQDERGMDLLLEAFEEKNLLHRVPVRNAVRLTTEGWIQIDGMHREKGRQASKRAFVAMAFNPPERAKQIADAFDKAIKAAGYDSVILLGRETNDKICELIIAEIRRSRFLIADFTGQKQNVYFEAGFALGLGLKVIWTCEKKEIEDNKLHFDTRQYSHIAWETPEDLTEKLTNRINATI